MRPLLRTLDTIGNGLGDVDMAVVGDTDHPTPQSFLLKPETTEVAIIDQIVIYVEDDGTFEAGKIGSATALSTGITIKAWRKLDVLIDLTHGVSIKTNGDIARIGSHSSEHLFTAGNSAMVGTIELSAMSIKLDGAKGDRLVALVSDDLDMLEHVYITAIGYWEKK